MTQVNVKRIAVTGELELVIEDRNLGLDELGEYGFIYTDIILTVKDMKNNPGYRTDLYLLRKIYYDKDNVLHREVMELLEYFIVMGKDVM